MRRFFFAFLLPRRHASFLTTKGRFTALRPVPRHWRSVFVSFPFFLPQMPGKRLSAELRSVQDKMVPGAHDAAQGAVPPDAPVRENFQEQSSAPRGRAEYARPGYDPDSSRETQDEESPRRGLCTAPDCHARSSPQSASAEVPPRSQPFPLPRPCAPSTASLQGHRTHRPHRFRSPPSSFASAPFSVRSRTPSAPFSKPGRPSSNRALRTPSRTLPAAVLP